MQENKKVIYADDLLSSLRDDETIDGAHFKRVKQHINAAPDAVVHGRWEKSPYFYEYLRCSVCHDCNVYDMWIDGKKWGYCPNCGAKMDGGNEDA